MKVIICTACKCEPLQIQIHPAEVTTCFVTFDTEKERNAFSEYFNQRKVAMVGNVYNTFVKAIETPLISEQQIRQHFNQGTISKQKRWMLLYF